jgi:Amino acid permease
MASACPAAMTVSPARSSAPRRPIGISVTTVQPPILGSVRPGACAGRPSAGAPEDAVAAIVAVVGIRESARVTGALVIVKVTICVFVVVAGLFFVRGANLSPFIPPGQPAPHKAGLAQPLIQAVAGVAPAVFGIGGVLTAAAVVFFAYTGFEAVANPSEETRRPSRDLPLGLLGTLGVSTALYIWTRPRRSRTRSTRSARAGRRPSSTSPPSRGSPR